MKCLKVNEYIAQVPLFAQEICYCLREIILDTDLGIVEGWKWGPNYQKAGMICGFSAFKQHVTLTFFKGSLLQDQQGILVGGRENQHNRSVKFTAIAQVDKPVLSAYIQEAIALNEQGVKVSQRTLVMPADLASALQEAELIEKFSNLSFTSRKELVISVTEAKQPITRERRIVRIIQKLKPAATFSRL